jgi:hypothetical protein
VDRRASGERGRERDISEEHASSVFKVLSDFWTLNMGAVGSAEPSVTILQSTQRHPR